MKPSILTKLFLLFALAIILSRVGATGNAATIDNTQRAYALKAAYLERFTRFITWPRHKGGETPFQLCTFGVDPFGDSLKAAFSGIKIQNRSVELHHIDQPARLNQCQLVFISDPDLGMLYQVLSTTTDRPILTVSDQPGFCHRGVLINFFVSDDRLRFEINESALRRSGLNASYHLLKAAKIIHPKAE